MDLIGREYVCKELGLGKQDYLQDVRSLAVAWSDIAECLDYATAGTLARVLMHLCAAYLRGHGVRLGNAKAFNQRGLVLPMLAMHVVLLVQDNQKKFPGLKALPATPEKFAEWLSAHR